jgi:uncharacterized protein (DUF362 family)
MPLPLSIIILTYNEELNLEDCLKSVQGWADEIFIVDSFSTDKTLEIAKRYTGKIYQHTFEAQSKQFQWGLDTLPISNEWIMRLDSDERLTEDLKKEIQGVLHDPNKDIHGIYLKLRVYFMGRWIRHGDYYPFILLRIWRKGYGQIESRLMDEHIVVDGKTITLRNDFIEENRKDISFWINKHNNYSTREVKQLLSGDSDGTQVSVKGSLGGNKIQRKRWFKQHVYVKLPLFLRAFLYFLYRYFFKLGFLDGKEGLIFHFLQAFWYRFLVDAKIYEMKKSEVNKESLLMSSKSHFVQIKKPVVILETLESNSNLNALKKQFSNAFTRLSIVDDFNKANAVFIKPNLGYPVYKKGVTTRKEFIEGLVAALREINSKTMIYIGEGEGGYNSFSMNEAFKNMGFYDLEKKYPNVRIINLSKAPSKDVAINTPKGTCNLDLPKIFFEEIDFSISCPVPKVHCMTGISLSYKNQWGCLPDAMRLKDHYILDHLISKISDILKFKYAFLDGKYGLNINGPMVGDPVEVNWFAASNSLGTFDMVVSEMMGFDWGNISHLRKAGEYGFIPKREDIDIAGDIELLKRKFVLKRDFWNYIAFIAFNSKKITHLVYFSRFAKLIHNIMYTFRKKQISE